MEKKFDIKEVKVHRTLEGTIFEIVFAATTIVVWGIIIWMIHKAPDIIPTHFDASGQPNDWGPKYGILIPCGIISLVGVGLMMTTYFPHRINMPFKITNIQQVKLAIRQIRIAGIILVLMSLAIAYTLLGMKSPSAVPVLALTALLFTDIVIFTILIRKAK